MEYMRKLMKKAHRGQGGFTLIELLVVVAILGVIAAVVVLNVGGFMGSGTESAANTEAHQVQTAIVAYMASVPTSTLTGGAPNSIGPTAAAGTEKPLIEAYLVNPLGMQADYTYDTEGKIDGAVKIANSKWGTLTYTAGTGWA